MSVSSASATASLTAEEVVVKSALGGQTWLVSSFNKTVNLASIGAGGMDTGAAPVSGYVALYVIFNPTTSAAALLAVNATLAAQPTTYAGANMPAGYTASALVSVWGVTGSQFRVGEQVDREVFTSPVSVLSTSSTSNTLIPLSVAAAAPLNSRKISGSYTAAVSANGFNGTISGAASGVGSQNFICNFSGTGGTVFRGLPVLTAQTIYYSITTAGTLTNFVINITCYEI
ncbi:hypothetical protein [Pseudomonas koreensis]|uniref:hypothetical protein n=1 Tax=Pseudomonas koreensis TaxID=198620 RepID=UPI003F84653E